MNERCIECDQRPEDGCMSGCQAARAVQAERELARVRSLVGEVIGDIEKMGGRYRFLTKLRAAVSNVGKTEAYRCACGRTLHAPLQSESEAK